VNINFVMIKMEDRLDRIEKDVEIIKKSLRKKVEERKLTLKEKFLLHDRAVVLLQQFEHIVSGVPNEDVSFYWVRGETLEEKKFDVKDLKEIVKSLANLVDCALGTKL